MVGSAEGGGEAGSGRCDPGEGQASCDPGVRDARDGLGARDVLGVVASP